MSLAYFNSFTTIFEDKTLDILELTKGIEAIDTWFLIICIPIETAIDLIYRQPRNYQDTIANLAIALVYTFLSTTLFYVCALTGITFFSQFSVTHLEINIWTTILAIAIADFLYYWEHRVEHQIKFFWAYHSVHHSSIDYNLTIASRISWVESFIIWIFYIPMALLGFDPLLILLSMQITIVYQTWLHTQKISHLGILEKIINTPALHRVHHASNADYIDKNYGAILMIWDRLFGTYQIETEPPVYGLTENINTNNPIKINTIEYQRIGKEILKSKNIKQVYHCIFGSPQWQIEDN